MNSATNPSTKGADMSASEMICRQFAGEFNTPNVKRAIALCEAGTLAWEEVEAIFASSLKKGLSEVA
jgi:hypothetical protein